jgi:hypothetical protein
MNLIYINELGPNYVGENIYEFIFSDNLDVDGEDWDSQPANGKPLPPNIKFIKKVGILKNPNINLNLIQNSDFFGVFDAVDGIIALGWENDESDFVLSSKDRRLVFRFGDNIKDVEDKLYARDIILKYEKKFADHETE